MKRHTSLDLWAHACVPSLVISFFLSSTCFLQWYQEMTEILECNSISLKSCTHIPDFSAEHQWKTENNWVANANELGFSTKRFNKNNITMPQVSFWAVLFHKYICRPYFTSRPELDFWQGTGGTSIKHLISPCLCLICAVYEIFWIKDLN